MLSDDEPVRGRQARHFYDIFYLLGDASPAIATLGDRSTVSEIVNDCREVSARWYGGDASNSLTCFADSSVFTRSELQDRLESAYDQACLDLCYPDAGRPSWDDVLVRVESRRDLLSLG